MSFFEFLWNASAFFFIFAFVSYLLFQFLVVFLPEKNLYKLYGESYAFITGGSSGIGKSLAKKLAIQGFNIVITGSTLGHLNEAEEEILKVNSQVKVIKIKANFSPDDGESVVNQVLNQVSNLDISILAINAGINGFGSVISPSIKAHTVLNTNVSTQHLLFDALFPKLIKRTTKHKGLVIFTCAGFSILPVPFVSTYSATKAYWETFGKSLAAESAFYGAHSLVVVPGPVSTRFDVRTPEGQIEGPVPEPNFAIQTPDAVASLALKAATRIAVVDTCLGTRFSRILSNVLDANLAIHIERFILPLSGAAQKVAAGGPLFGGRKERK